MAGDVKGTDISFFLESTCGKPAVFSAFFLEQLCKIQ